MRLRIILFPAVLAALSGCGGGSGGAGGDLSVSPTAVALRSLAGLAPPDQTLTATWTAPDAYYLAVGFPPGAGVPSWLLLGEPVGTGLSRTLRIGASPAPAPGTRSATIRLVLARQDQSIITTRDVQVTQTATGLGTFPTTASRTVVFGGSVAPAPVDLSVEGRVATAWTATADRPWIHLGAASGTVPSPLTVSLDPAGLAMGTYTGTVTLTSTTDRAEVPVTLEVRAPILTVTPGRISLAGAGGHDLAPKALEVSLDTGTNAYPFTVTTGDGWIALEPAAGTASGTPVSVSLAPSPAARAWAAGLTEGRLVVTATVHGVPLVREIPVAYQLDDAKLFVSETGVAFTSTPDLSRLTRSLRVGTNRGNPVRWTATADRPWLSVTASGSEADPLVLTADPAGLGADSLQEATVTVTTADAAVADQTDVVRVGLWVGATTAATTTTVAVAGRALATDPVRPYAYVATGAGVTVFNVHTGAVVGSVPGVGGSALSLAVASDGSALYAADGTRRVVPISLPSLTPAPAWFVPGTQAPDSIAFARTNKVPILVTSAGTLQAPASGVSYGSFPGLTAVAVSRDGSRLCAINGGISPYSLRCWALDSTTAGSSPVLIGPAAAAPFNVGSNGADVALSPDGRWAYAAAGSPYALTVFDAGATGALPEAAQLPMAPYPTAVDVGFDGRVFGGVDVGSSATVWSFDQAGSVLQTWKPGSVLRRCLRISGDGLRLVALIGEQPPSSSMSLLTVP